MNVMRLDTQAKLLAFAAVVEAGTGIALMIDPALVVNMLLGSELAGVGIILARCFGIALVALSVACWPAVQRAGGGSPAFRAMLIYNVAIASLLVYAGTALPLRGVLFWPAVALHAIVALALVLVRKAPGVPTH
jgi:hypothetical protein